MSGQSKFIVLLLVLFLQACASVTPPNGGPKDITAPKLTMVIPADKSLNYGNKQVTLEFDEEVELKDLQKELIVTPYTDNTYETKVSKKTITLEFEKPLLPNTTYTLNFRNAIRDLTEGNAAVIKPITFSTGAYLDSGIVSGTVVRHLTDQPEPETDILLYRTQDTGTVKTTKPFYVTRTNAAGAYSFTHLATGTYYIYALTDKNNSLTYDQDIERIGYRNDSVIVTAKTPPADLRTVRIDAKKPYIIKRTPRADKAEIEYSEGLTKFSILNQPQSADSLIYWMHENQKTVYIHRDSSQSSFKFIATATDSIGLNSIDTVSLSFTQRYTTKPVNLSSKNGSNYRPGTEIELNSPVPIKEIKANAFTIMPDSATKIVLPASAINLSADRKTIKVLPIGIPKNKASFSFLLDSAAIKTITGQYVTHFVNTLKITDQENTGSVSGTIVSEHPNYILQLLSSDYKVIEEKKNSPRSFAFTNLDPSTYRLRILVDTNNNGKWDNGSSDLKQLPEPVIVHQEPIEIRANWNLEDVALSTTKNVENPKRK